MTKAVVIKKTPTKRTTAKVEKVQRNKRVPTKLTPEAQVAFLDAISQGMRTRDAAELIGVSVQALYKRANVHDDFQQAWTEAKDMKWKARADVVEDVMWTRAVDGYTEVEKKTYKTPGLQDREIIKATRKVDNTLLLRIAEAAMPDKYGRIKVDKTVEVGEGLADLLKRASEEASSDLQSALKP